MHTSQEVMGTQLVFTSQGTKKGPRSDCPQKVNVSENRSSVAQWESEISLSSLVSLFKLINNT